MWLTVYWLYTGCIILYTYVMCDYQCLYICFSTFIYIFAYKANRIGIFFLQIKSQTAGFTAPWNHLFISIKQNQKNDNTLNLSFTKKKQQKLPSGAEKQHSLPIWCISELLIGWLKENTPNRPSFIGRTERSELKIILDLICKAL